MVRGVKMTKEIYEDLEAEEMKRKIESELRWEQLKHIGYFDEVKK